MMMRDPLQSLIDNSNILERTRKRREREERFLQSQTPVRVSLTPSRVYYPFRWGFIPLQYWGMDRDDYNAAAQLEPSYLEMRGAVWTKLELGNQQSLFIVHCLGCLLNCFLVL